MSARRTITPIINVNAPQQLNPTPSPTVVNPPVISNADESSSWTKIVVIFIFVIASVVGLIVYLIFVNTTATVSH